MAEIEEFRGYLAIDKGQLDEEVVRQPSLYLEVSESQVMAVAERDTLKERLGVVDAELDISIRRQLEKDETKATETMVKNLVLTHKKHAQAFDAYMTAKTAADMLGVLRESFHQRKSMLQELVQLHVTNYFETSSIGAKSDAVYRQRREQMALARAKRD